MSFLRKYRSGLTAVAAVVVFYAVLSLLGLAACPIKWVTGISCPGCGMTRAWARVLHLDFHGAWDFHPLFWVVPIVVVAFFLQKRYPVVWKGVISAAVTGFIIVYLFRMFDPDCTVVVFEPRNSLFYRIIQYLT